MNEYHPPAMYAEFLSRYPEWCRREALRLLGSRATRDAVSELEQEFHAHLLGRQIVERFDPGYYDTEPTEAIYRLYIRTCLTRHYLHINDKRKRLKRTADVISLESQPLGCESTVGESISDDCVSIEQAENRIILVETRRFLANHPRLLETFELMASGLSAAETAQQLGITPRGIHKRLQKIRELVT